MSKATAGSSSDLDGAIIASTLANVADRGADLRGPAFAASCVAEALKALLTDQQMQLLLYDEEAILGGLCQIGNSPLRPQQLLSSLGSRADAAECRMETLASMGFFDKLEAAGARPMTSAARVELSVAILTFEEMSEWERSKTDGKQALRKITQATATKADEMVEAIERLLAFLRWPILPSSKYRKLIEELRDFADTVRPEPPRPGGSPQPEHYRLVDFCARIYTSIGGRAGNNERFKSFLRIVWEALPDESRPKSADAFANKVKTIDWDSFCSSR
jgi:hypothetical protein